MSIVQKVSNLNVIQWLGTRKVWAWPGALGFIALSQSGIINLGDDMQTLAAGMALVGALLTQWHDAERDKRMGA